MQRIGIDIDGVIANTFSLLVDELNAFFGKNIKYADVNQYQIGKVYNIDNNQIQQFIKEKGNLLIEGPKPMPGAVECLKAYKEKSYLAIVSARAESFRSLTENWLRRYHISFDDLILLGSHEKAQTCVNLKLDIFIEDSMQNALQISSAGVPVILFDAPYNKGDLPALVRRYYSWPDICKYLHQMRLDGFGAVNKTERAKIIGP